MVHEHEYTLNWAYNRINKLVADAYEETAKEGIQKVVTKVKSNDNIQKHDDLPIVSRQLRW